MPNHEPVTIRTVNLGHPTLDLLVTIDEMTDGVRTWAESAYSLNGTGASFQTWDSLAGACRNFMTNFGCRLLVAKQ